MLVSADPRLAANKRLVYDFWREVFEGGHMELAEKYLAESYIQHNPNVPTGRAAFVEFFTRFRKPAPIEAQIKAPVVAIVAEGRLRRPQLRARARRPEGSGEEVHDDVVRHVPDRRRQDRRALGSGAEAVAVTVAAVARRPLRRDDAERFPERE